MSRTVTNSVSATTSDESISSLRIEKSLLIDAPRDIVWESLLEELGPAGLMPDGTPFPKVLEAFPGGRWYRDLGNNAGHCWGHVQVIKPPGLLEISGPIIMSYPVASHLQWRLTDESGKTRLGVIHRAFGQIAEKDRQMDKGWEWMLNKTREAAEKRK